MSVQRPGDLYWLTVRYDDNATVPFSIDAIDDDAALYETEYVLNQPRYAVSPMPVCGTLYRASGEVVAEVNADA